MNQVILFSPVGGTDPISATNFRDGSLLHICRVYRPSKIILYMSAEVLQNHRADNRYIYCLDQLAQKQNRTIDYEIIERADLKEVQEFDYFYQDFRNIVERVFSEMDDSDMLILNVSSGTPAMKSGLLVLQTLGEFPCRMIQVTTPERCMNEHIHKGFDVEEAWELNEDNDEEAFINRCREIQCPTLSVIKKEEIIKKHVGVYDYGAAVSVAQTMPEQYTKNYYKLLVMAQARMLLDFKSVDKILGTDVNDFLPIKESGKRKCFEYALNLQVKLWRKEYADFVRAITPLVVDLLEMVLKCQFKIDINQYCWYKKKEIIVKGKKILIETREWDRRRLKDTDILEKFNQEYRDNFKYGNIYSIHLKILIQKSSGDKKLNQLTDDLRFVEEQIRNMAAHEIVSITEDTIIRRTGFTGKQIMNKIKDIFTYTGICVKNNDWDSYNDMNREIIDRIKKSAQI